MAESSSSSDSSGSSSTNSSGSGSPGNYQLVSGYSSATPVLTAVAQAGAGGAATDSTPEYYLQGASGESDGQLAWAINGQGQLNDSVGIELNADLDGPADSTWAVGSGSYVALFAGNSGSIEKVQIGVTVVGANLKGGWDALELEFFYDGGSEHITLPGSVTPVVDTLAAGTGGTQVVEIVPANGSSTKVNVTGFFLLESNVAGMPGAQDIVGKILVFGS